MTSAVLSPLDALESGWRITRRHYWFLTVALLLSYLAGALPTLVRDAVLPLHRPLAIAVALSTVLLEVIFCLGLVRISLRLYDDDDAGLNDLVGAADQVISGVIALALVCILFMLSVLPLIVAASITTLLSVVSATFIPLVMILSAVAAMTALYSLARFIFFAHIIVDHNAGPIRALQASADLTRRERGHAVALLAMLLVLNIGGLVIAGIGLLITMPLSLLTITAAYRRLLTRAVPSHPSPGGPAPTLHSTDTQRDFREHRPE